VVGCIAKASCFACVGTCLYGGAGDLFCSAAAVFLCSVAASLAFMNLVKRGMLYNGAVVIAMFPKVVLGWQGANSKG